MLWATPLAFVVHNAEEAWAFPRYLPRVQGYLPEALRAPQISIAAIHVALAIVAAAFLAAAAWATLRPESGAATWTAVLVPAIGALNAIAHVASAVLLLRGYTPGLVTALCLVAPISALALHRAWRERWLTPRGWGLLALGATLPHVPILIVLLRVAEAG